MRLTNEGSTAGVHSEERTQCCARRELSPTESPTQSLGLLCRISFLLIGSESWSYPLANKPKKQAGSCGKEKKIKQKQLKTD